MIAPYQRWWWMSILLDDDGNHLDPGYDIIELMAEQHDLPLLVARRIWVGAKGEEIIKEDKTHNDFVFNGVNHVNPNKTPDWVEQARDLKRYGVTTFGESDILLFNGSLLVRKASQNIESINNNVCFQVDYDKMMKYIQQVTVFDRSDTEEVLERQKEGKGVMNYQDGKFVCEMEGVSKIKEW